MILVVAQIVVSILLVIAILLQAQGQGLSSAFGGGGEFYHSRKSAEKMLIWATLVLAALFAILSLILLLPR